MKTLLSFLCVCFVYAFVAVPQSFAAPGFKQNISFSGLGSSLYTELRLPIDTFTVEMWMKFPPFTNSETGPKYLFTSRDALSGVENSMYLSGSSSVNNGMDAWLTGFGQGSTFYYLTVPTKLTANTWYHIAFVRNGSGYAVFINGNLAISQSNTGTYAYAQQMGMTIGGWPTGQWGTPYMGYTGELSAVLDEFRVSDSARYTTSFPVKRSPFGLDAHTIGLFHFDNNLYDATGFKRPLMTLPGYSPKFVKSSIPTK